MKNSNTKNTSSKKNEIEFLTLDSEDEIKNKKNNTRSKDKTNTKAKKETSKKESKDAKEKNRNKNKDNTNKKKKDNKKKNNKKEEKKRYIIVFAIFIIIFTIFITSYMSIFQKFLVKKEIEHLEVLIVKHTDNKKEIEKALNKTVSIGKYRKIETAYKNYIEDILKVTYEIEDLTNDKKLSYILSTENLETDGKEFKTTTSYLNSTRVKITDRFYTLIDLMSKDKIMSYVENENFTKEEISFYKKVAIDKNDNLEKMQNSLRKSKEYYIGVFEIFDKAINFLKKSNNWKIKEGKLEFSSKSDYNKYNEIIKNLNTKEKS